MSDEELIKQLLDKNGFIKHNHFEVIEVVKGKKVIMKVHLKEESLNPYGFAHGGLIFGLGDTAMGMAAKSSGRSAVTLSSSITYLKPTSGDEIRAEAEIIKNGKTTCYLRCNFYDENDKLTATMDANYFYID